VKVQLKEISAVAIKIYYEITNGECWGCITGIGFADVIKGILYTYNALGWKVWEQLKVKDGDPESWHKIYFSYDKNSHLTLVKNGFGAQACYNYDCLGKVALEERVIDEGVQSAIYDDYNKNSMCIKKTEKHFVTAG